MTGFTNWLLGFNVGATKEEREPNHAGNLGGRSVWWSWTAPAAGEVTIAALGYPFDTLLGIYTGTAISNLRTVTYNNDYEGGSDSLVRVRTPSCSSWGQPQSKDQPAE